MQKLKTEGVILHALPFRNYDSILTLFTPEEGLIKLFFRGAYSKKKGYGAATTTPLSIVEVIYTKGRGDLFSCVDIAVLHHNLALRNTLTTLEAGCEMLQCISYTQQPGKSAPELYQLLVYYLTKLPLIPTPTLITSSFRLKLLRYEGLLALLSHCCVCATPLNDTWIYGSEAFCPSHTPSQSLSITKEEREIIESLAFCRDFNQLKENKVTALLSQKICRLFDESFS